VRARPDLQAGGDGARHDRAQGAQHALLVGPGRHRRPGGEEEGDPVGSDVGVEDAHPVASRGIADDLQEGVEVSGDRIRVGGDPIVEPADDEEGDRREAVVAFEGEIARGQPGAQGAWHEAWVVGDVRSPLRVDARIGREGA